MPQRIEGVLDGPLGRYDLSGRDVCVFGGCLEEGLQDVGEFGESVAGTAAEGGEYVAGKASEWTAPVRHYVAGQAQDFAKESATAWHELVDIWNAANEAVACVGTAVRHPHTEYECLPSVGPHKITPETFFESPPGNFPPSGPGASPVTGAAAGG